MRSTVPANDGPPRRAPHAEGVRNRVESLVASEPSLPDTGARRVQLMKGPLFPARPALPVLRILAVWAGTLLLSGCLGVMDDAEQPVTVFTDPPGAHCELSRNGRRIGAVSPSPGLLRVNNRKSDIAVHCSKALHADATAVLASSRRDLTIGDIVVKGPIGLAVDAGTGAARGISPPRLPSTCRRFRSEARRNGTATSTA